MKPIKIMADSTCDLSEALIKERDITIIPLHVNFNDESYLDGVDITPELLYQKVDELGFLPKSAAVSPGEFLSYFESEIALEHDIIVFTIGSDFSGTYQSALIASEQLPKGSVTVIDSKNLSSGIGLLLLKATDLKNEGKSVTEIVTAIYRLIPLVRSQFAIQTMEYLYKGGRCSALTMLFGSMLSIKPIIAVDHGKMDVYKKALGKMSRALDIMLDDYQERIEQIDLDYVMITHSLADKSAEYIKEKIMSIQAPKHLIETHAGSVISTHCGKGTIGILYILKA